MRKVCVCRFFFPGTKRVKTSEGKQIRNFPEASRGDQSMISGREMMMFKSFRGRQTSLCHKIDIILRSPRNPGRYCCPCECRANVTNAQRKMKNDALSFSFSRLGDTRKKEKCTHSQKRKKKFLRVKFCLFCFSLTCVLNESMMNCSLSGSTHSMHFWTTWLPFWSLTHFRTLP